eukprot:Seg973.6 transcript_id=Seg973.6/GoldUCD/mRNA.D3Y31 product="PiggyBac transposable element-derived protein 4" protein_id=Seg973.6/GoldUCD/D3Y31
MGKKTDPNSKKLIWTTAKPPVFGRTSAANIIRNVPGPTPLARRTTDKASAWNLFINEIMVTNMVLHTNQRISNIIEKLPEEYLQSSKVPYIREIDEIEMRSFVGLWMVRDVLHQDLDDVTSLWSHELVHPINSATMSKNRFKFLMSVLSFDEHSTRVQRWQHEQFNENCAKVRIPSEFVAIDETLYSYRGNIGFRQYNPSKPAKYGLLYRSVSDSVCRYTYFSLQYAGKPHGPPNEFYVNSVDGYTILVTLLMDYRGMLICRGEIFP